MFRTSPPGSVNGNSIRVTLECTGPALKHPTRQLELYTGRPITIGRASKNTTKNLQPSPQNAFFDCPVMSRNHAELFKRDGVYHHVMLRDTGSLHGTFVNDRKVVGEAYLHSGDVIKFGDAVNRLHSIHDGVQVRVGIEHPNAAATQATQTTQATFTGIPVMASNTFKVPSDSGDDQANKICIDEDEDEDDDDDDDDDEDEDVTPSDDEDDRLSVFSGARNSPLSKSVVSDDSNIQSSGPSHRNPIIIEDEDMPQLNKTTSPFGSPPNSPTRFGDFDDSDHDSEVEYADDQDAFDEFHDDRLANGPNCGYRSRFTRPRAMSEGSEASDESEDSDSQPSPKQQPKADLPESQPATSAIQYQEIPQQPTSQDTAMPPSLFPSDRTLPNPENLKLPGLGSRFADYLPPIDNMPNYAASDIFRPSHYMQGFEQHRYVYHPESALDGNKPYGMQTRYVPPEGFEYPYTSFKDTAKAAPTPPPAFDASAHTYMQPGVAAPGTVEEETECRKRKREVEDEGEGEEGGSGHVRLDALLNVVAAGATANGKRHDSAAELTQDTGVEQAVQGSEAAEGTALTCAEAESLIAGLQIPSLAGRSTRPAKRARTSSLGLALTAAAGAVGGCVATVSFLWSPLAERLLA